MSSIKPIYRQWAVLILTVGALAALGSGCASPYHVYLTWQNDPCTTMTVNFQTPASEAKGIVYYDTEPHGDDTAAYRFKAETKPHTVPFIEGKRAVYSVELKDLEPDTTYHFVYGPEGKRISMPRKFRTIPNDDSPIRFVAGGDQSILPRARLLMRQAAAQEPDFVLIGGDIAYANGNPRNLFVWDRYLQMWEVNMITPEGYTVPVVYALGNHETNGDHEEPELNAPFYFGFFAQGGMPYFARKFGPRVLVIVLDSGHTVPHDGAQAEWLRATLEANKDVPFRFASYHVPFYPSHRDFEGSPSVAGRTHWLPLFDEFGLTAAFEHHDHTFKRTKPLRNNQVDPEGIVYLGDGCMGVPPRSIDNEGAWYLEKASSTAHIWLVDVGAEGANFQAIDRHGQVFDRYPEP